MHQAPSCLQSHIRAHEYVGLICSSWVYSSSNRYQADDFDSAVGYFQTIGQVDVFEPKVIAEIIQRRICDTNTPLKEDILYITTQLTDH